MASNVEKKVDSRLAGATAAVLEALAEVVNDSTVGAHQLRLLLACYMQRELSQNDLPKYTGVDRSANSRNVQKFGEGQWILDRVTGQKTFVKGTGLVESYRDPMNQRFQMVRLTPQGRAVIEQAVSKGAAYL